VVRNEANSRRLNDTIVVVISSNVARAKTEPTQLFISPTDADGARRACYSIQPCNAKTWRTSTHNLLFAESDRCLFP
jgi:hypothetical protein